MRGKKVLPPPDRSACGIWPFEAPKTFLDFVIEEDECGRPVEHTCNPDLLANYFGANPGAPNYLTPVFFRREVLRKYYDNSDRFEVVDGMVRHVGMWGLRVDNNHAEQVMVFLGDLGRDLPTSEQRYWRHYNLLPEERELSETAIRRSFFAEFAEADLPEHRFKRAYATACQTWKDAFGWLLFKDLHPQDQHVLKSLRLPLSNSTDEFDSQVLDLAKLLVDSLNEEQISRQLQEMSAKHEKGIAKIERLLIQWKYPSIERDITLLRTIQGIRSRGVAHRKSSDYDLAETGLNPDDLHGSFRELLERGIEMLSDLASFAVKRRK